MGCQWVPVLYVLSRGCAGKGFGDFKQTYDRFIGSGQSGEELYGLLGGGVSLAAAVLVSPSTIGYCYQCLFVVKNSFFFVQGGAPA